MPKVTAQLISQTVSGQKSNHSGVSLVEALVAIAILLLVTTVLLSAFLLYMRIASGGPDNLSASYLMFEGVEALRSVRDRSWSEHLEPLEAGETYHLIFDQNNSHWSIATGTAPLINDKFERTFTVHQVHRDPNTDAIVDSDSGEPDPDTLMFSLEVVWDGLFGESSRQVSTYLSNMFWVEEE